MKNSSFFRQSTDYVRRFSSKVLVNNDLISFNQEKIRDIASILSTCRVSDFYPISNLANQEVDYSVGLLMSLGVMQYCFVNPFSKLEYSYVLGNQTVKRSGGFITALNNSGVDWASFHEIDKLTVSDWYAILQTKEEGCLYNINGRFFDLQKLTSYLIKSGISSASKLIDSVKDCAQLFKILHFSGLYNDLFLKRVQATINLINRILYVKKRKYLLGSEFMTAMADYRLPQLFYNYDCIRIPEGLVKRLINKEVMLPSSKEEVSLRASVIVIVEIISKLLNKSEAEVDAIAWILSQKLIDGGEMKIPAMLVPTKDY